MNRKAIVSVCLASAACVLLPSAAMAEAATAPAPATADTPAADAPQAVNDSQLQEIVVTAQRRSESLQQVPIAISAVSGSQLASRGIGDSTSLAQTIPNLDVSQNGTVLTLYMRGVGSNASDPNDEESVAFYVDGVYIASPLANIFDFNNIERVEVLKGPQGTLFGRNATGGVIQVITRDPKQTLGAEGSVSYGNYNTVGATGYVTGGVTSNLSADIAAVYHNIGDGYGTNTFLNIPIMRRKDLSVRSKWVWAPDATTTIKFTADYSLVRSDGTDYQLAPGVIGADGVSTYPGPYRTITNEPDLANSDNWGVSARIEKDFGAARLVSISAYRHIVGEYNLDEDATPAPVVNSYIHQLARTFSQELQLLSPTASNLQWVFGAYYFNATYGYTPITIGGLAFGSPTASESIYGYQTTRSASAYAQATYEILPATKLTAGLRYTDEQQGITSTITAGTVVVATPTPQSQAVDKATWRLALDHQFTRDVLGYVSYNRGMKSGGYNMINPTAPGYKPEILDAYEVGLKSELLDHLVRLNVAGFYYNYKDIQVQNIQAGSVNTVNAASARIYGFDGDLTIVPVKHLTLSASLGYTYGTYRNFENATFTPPSPLDGPQYAGNASGNFLVNTPKWTASGAFDYRIPTDVGTWAAGGSISYKGTTFVDADNRLTIPEHTVANATLSWTSVGDRYSVQFWVHNLTDARYYASRTETSVGDLQYLAPPRTYGATVGVKF
jgi:iron complex outermembrane receptor protein